MTEKSPMSLFGRTFKCQCGRMHAVEPGTVVCSDEVMDLLPAVCAAMSVYTGALVLSDTRTFEAAGRRAAGILAGNGWKVHPLTVPDPSPGVSPVCDDVTLKFLAPRAIGAPLIVTVGSGVVTDLGKWLAFNMGVPLVVVPTAASMNGYASANVAPTLKGVKSLLRARPARAVLADPQVLRDAPFEMTAAGLGDVLAKSFSSADWRMNHILFGDDYCEKSVGLIAEIEPLYMEHPDAIRDRRPEAMKALFDALLLTGAAMTMAGTSAPASGGEHAVSHTLDMMSSLDGRPHDLHGRQVGVGSIIAAELYRRVLAIESPTFAVPGAGVDAAFWGKLAKPVKAAYAEKIERLNTACEKLASPEAWDALRAELSPMPAKPEMIRDCLRRAGAAATAGDIRCDRDRLRTALLHAHEIRSRFTIIDVARLMGLLPGSEDDLLDAAGV